MQATITSMALSGIDAHPINIEIYLSHLMAGYQPTFKLSGPSVNLSAAQTREIRTRVCAALRAYDVDLDLKWAVSVVMADGCGSVLAPQGAHDLGIAIGILAALGKVDADSVRNTVLIGELSLDGKVRPVRGVLPMLLGAKTHGYRRAIVPRENDSESSMSDCVDVRSARTFAGVIEHLAGVHELPHAVARQRAAASTIDLADVAGQSRARRALEIAAAGGHGLLLIGFPGAGKTMFARRLSTLLPSLTDEEWVTVTAIRSAAGLISSDSGVISRERPFRAPHYTCSEAALLGGGTPVRPGEVTLAHHGVLFLDELLEFRPTVLAGLRQPLEEGVVTIHRAKERVTLPARPLLVAATNPCPCGHHGSTARVCRCPPDALRRYRRRLVKMRAAFPVVLRLEQLPPGVAMAHDMGVSPRGECSADVRARVTAVRNMRHVRDAARIDQHWVDVDHSESGGTLDATLRVALTIADLDGSADILPAHLAEASTWTGDFS